MAVDIKNLVAAINPGVFCAKDVDERGNALKDEVKKIAKSEGYLKAAEKAKLADSEYMDVLQVMDMENPFSLSGIKSPVEKHELSYDAFSQNLEPIYFWILDYVKEVYGGAEKLVDNFVSSVGGGHFAEIQARATRMQEEGMKIFGTVNTVIRSILNLIYDLKEFKLRLDVYDDYHSKDSRTRSAANLSLKQIWLDGVDIKRGNSSIKAMAQQFDFVTLIDAFMAAKTLKHVDKIDLNERVKRILQQRISDYERWVKESERELRKRFEVEKVYLKSQVHSLKLYVRWLKPYLKAARDLEQNMGATADVVHLFNTALFELVVLAEGKYDPVREVDAGILPKLFKKTKMRKYTPLTLIEFRFRSIPERGDQRGGYTYRGKVDVVFTSFALNEDELKVLKEKIAESDFGDAYEYIAGATDESIGQIQEDLDELIGDGKKEKKEEKKSEDSNPFSALFSFLKKDEKKKSVDLSKGIEKDSSYEEVVRSRAILEARRLCRKLYDDYKKAHGMPAFPPTQE